MAETLEQVLADAKGEIPVLKKRGGIVLAEALEEFVTRIEQATHDFRTFVSEKEAMVRGDKSQKWLRDRFPEWQRQGNARFNPKNPRERQYRLLIVPVAANTSAARSDAVRTARGEQ